MSVKPLEIARELADLSTDLERLSRFLHPDQEASQTSPDLEALPLLTRDIAGRSARLASALTTPPAASLQSALADLTDTINLPVFANRDGPSTVDVLTNNELAQTIADLKATIAAYVVSS